MLLSSSTLLILLPFWLRLLLKVDSFRQGNDSSLTPRITRRQALLSVSSPSGGREPGSQGAVPAARTGWRRRRAPQGAEHQRPGLTSKERVREEEGPSICHRGPRPRSPDLGGPLQSPAGSVPTECFSLLSRNFSPGDSHLTEQAPRPGLGHRRAGVRGRKCGRSGEREEGSSCRVK